MFNTKQLNDFHDISLLILVIKLFVAPDEDVGCIYIYILVLLYVSLMKRRAVRVIWIPIISVEIRCGKEMLLVYSMLLYNILITLLCPLRIGIIMKVTKSYMGLYLRLPCSVRKKVTSVVCKCNCIICWVGTSVNVLKAPLLQFRPWPNIGHSPRPINHSTGWKTLRGSKNGLSGSLRRVWMLFLNSDKRAARNESLMFFLQFMV